ncbi:MAG: aminotransferase class IV family protein [Anaerolineae bacterium]|nr:aminotransferase class IV family protein [Anaerolineae bacterium]
MPPVTFEFVQGQLRPAAIAGASLDDISRALPQGAYTTLRTYGGRRFLDLPHHLARLDESLSLMGGTATVDEQDVRQALRAALEATVYPEARVRVTVPLAGVPIYVTVEPFTPYPAELYRDGVRTVTMLMARQNPRAKATTFIAPSRDLKSTLPPGVHEVLMVDGRGAILEGFSSNFFGVLDGELRTADEGVLAGVTRGIVLQAARGVLPVRLEPVLQPDIPRLAEAFITSSSREVMPVVSINDDMVGDGRPGPITRAIAEHFALLVGGISEEP